MGKEDLTILLALAMAAQRAGLVIPDAQEAVNISCGRAANIHKMMGERDTLVIGSAAPKAILIGLDQSKPRANENAN